MHQKSKSKSQSAVAFVYSGDVVKSKTVYFFCVDDVKNLNTHVHEKLLVEHYGPNFSCKYATCDNSEKMLADVIDKAKELKYATIGHIVTANINNASTLLKTVTGATKTHEFCLQGKTEANAEKQKPKPKTEKQITEKSCDEKPKPKADKPCAEKPKPKAEKPKPKEKKEAIAKKKHDEKFDDNKSDDENSDDDKKSDSESDIDDDEITSSIGSVDIESDSDIDSTTSDTETKKKPKVLAKKVPPKKKK